MSEATARFALPFILPGQAQKELFHNEALQTLDLLAGAAVEQPPLDAPPASPAIGSCYIVGTAPTGAWAGQAGKLAGFTSGGWRFIAAQEGLAVHVRSSAVQALFRAGAWELGQVRGDRLVVAGQQVVGSRAAAIADPAGGIPADAEARAAIGSILEALRQHGLIAS